MNWQEWMKNDWNTRAEQDEYLEFKLPNFETILQQPIEFERAVAALGENGGQVDHVAGRNTDFLRLGGRKPA